MTKLHHLSIEWNYDTDERMTLSKSSEPVLQNYFCMRNWDYIRYSFQDVWRENDTGLENRRIEFQKEYVNLYVDEQVSKLEKNEFLKTMYHLYDVMIIGANDDHHSVRYEPWWQEFTEVFYQMKRKIEIENELY